MIDQQTIQANTDFLIKDIGLRGLQYGEYVTDEARAHHLPRAAEALADLADIVGLPDKFMSFNGVLGLGIGARGTGRALAHYEPDAKVINLTRDGGVGSLAHEWGHALDNYLTGGADFLTKELERWNPDMSKAPTPEIAEAMKGVIQSFGESGFTRRLRDVTYELRKQKKMGATTVDYWRSTLEVFARSFERYTQDKLTSAGRKNTYLVGLRKDDGGADGLWPTREETKVMTPAFDALMDAIRRWDAGQPKE